MIIWLILIFFMVKPFYLTITTFLEGGNG